MVLQAPFTRGFALFYARDTSVLSLMAHIQHGIQFYQEFHKGQF